VSKQSNKKKIGVRQKDPQLYDCQTPNAAKVILLNDLNNNAIQTNFENHRPNIRKLNYQLLGITWVACTTSLLC
jgi:hypothetical protein